MATPYDQIVTQLYREQLGREPEPEGAAYWAGQLASGMTTQEARKRIANELEGQNYLTQLATSVYRQELARNPEQAGYQYWLSRALAEGLSGDQLRNLITYEAEKKEKVERGIQGQRFTNLQLPDLEADPWGGRYATTSIYNLPTNQADRINVSYIKGVPVQFVSPVTQQQYITTYGQDAWNEVAGDEVLSVERVKEAMNRAVKAGSMTQAEYQKVIKDLAGVTDPAGVRKVLGIPQGAVIIDPKYGQQIGEDNALEIALAEAARRQEVLTKQDPGYYQASDVLGNAYKAAGLDWPFFTDTYKANTMMTQADKLTPENLSSRVNQLIAELSREYEGQFGGMVDLPTTISPQYYSEAGLQPSFTPFGTPDTTFRSGVAGYVPPSELPTGFQFGAPLVNASFREYRPGAFQPEGVTTGGYITGYTAEGNPIYSAYSNPQAYRANEFADLQAQVAALQAAQNNPIGQTGG